MTTPPVPLVGDGLAVACVDGTEREYLSFDSAASTAALPSVLQRVEEFLPRYSSVHRGAGYKSQFANRRLRGSSRAAAVAFAGRSDRDDIAIICRNTTEAINHLAYRLRLDKGDVVVTTVVEHHANLLPWSRVATCRFVECDEQGTFSVDAVERALEESPRPSLLAVTGASNITGWMPSLAAIIEAAHARGIPVVVDAAQLAPHRSLPTGADFLAFSGHKMYAPFGAGILIGPRAAFTDGDPFLAGGGAVDLVDLDEVAWTAPPDREEAGSPNVVGAVALHSAIDALGEIGWTSLTSHDRTIAQLLRTGLAEIEGVRLLGPPMSFETLPVATFVVDGLPHALLAARLSAEHTIGVRHGCFSAHPYLIRLLGLSQRDAARYRDEIRRGDHTNAPGAVRASGGINTTKEDVSQLLGAVSRLARGEPSPSSTSRTPAPGTSSPKAAPLPGSKTSRAHGSSCSPG